MLSRRDLIKGGLGGFVAVGSGKLLPKLALPSSPYYHTQSHLHNPYNPYLHTPHNSPQAT